MSLGASRGGAHASSPTSKLPVIGQPTNGAAPSPDAGTLQAALTYRPKKTKGQLPLPIVPGISPRRRSSSTPAEPFGLAQRPLPKHHLDALEKQRKATKTRKQMEEMWRMELELANELKKGTLARHTQCKEAVRLAAMRSRWGREGENKLCARQEKCGITEGFWKLTPPRTTSYPIGCFGNCVHHSPRTFASYPWPPFSAVARLQPAPRSKRRRRTDGMLHRCSMQSKSARAGSPV